MGKNLQKVKDMVDGKFGGFKTQVGYGDQDAAPVRKVGDKWTDSEGYEWEQKEGFKVKNSTMPAVGIFHQVCEDCGTNCSLDKRHRTSFVKFNKCFYCQMDFEIKLQSWPGKWEAWVRLQQLNNMDVIEKEMVQALEEDEKVDKKMRTELKKGSVANALSNWETEQQIEYNKKLTGQ